MNIQLFTNDDVRENVLKHVRGGQGLCYAPPESQSVTGGRRNTYTSLSSGNKPNLGRIQIHHDSKALPPLSPLFNSAPSDGSSFLSPTYTYRSEAFAEDLVEELNWRTENEA